MDSDTVNLTARVINPETIIFGGNFSCKGAEQADWGGVAARSKVLTAVSYKMLPAHKYHTSFCD
jgi:hypothetical protein